jgi:hypothetical protein
MGREGSETRGFQDLLFIIMMIRECPDVCRKEYVIG